ncbi:MAG TPA: hypothetical protein VF914_15135 [Chloroflexia bacterium]
MDVPAPNFANGQDVFLERAAPNPGGNPPAGYAPLYELRSEVQHLQQVLASIRKGEADLATYAPYIEKTVSDIEALIPTIRYDQNPDGIRHILNLWEQMQVSPLLQTTAGNIPDLDAQKQLQNLNMLDAQSRRLVFEIGQITIPGRLQDWLNSARTGYYIPFHPVFEDEVPDREDRVKILNAISWASNRLKGGIIDLSSGLVYKYSDRGLVQVMSALGVVLALAVSTLILVLIGINFNVKLGSINWPLNWNIGLGNVSALVGAWVAMLAGILVHMGVSFAKRAQSAVDLPPVLAPVEFLPRLNANLGPTLLRVFLALVSLIGLAYATGVDSLTPVEGFLAGYSLDSIIDLIGGALDQRSTAQISSLKKTLEVPTSG